MDGGIYVPYPIDQRGPDAAARLCVAIAWLKTEAIAGRVAKCVFDPATPSA